MLPIKGAGFRSLCKASFLMQDIGRIKKSLMRQEVPVPSEESSNDGSEVTSDSIQASENSATPLAEESELTNKEQIKVSLQKLK